MRSSETVGVERKVVTSPLFLSFWPSYFSCCLRNPNGNSWERPGVSRLSPDSEPMLIADQRL
jgi:hypothetical protein